jgi:hypothetical protein
MKGPGVTDFVDANPVNRGEAPKCPSCGRFISGLVWLPPYRAVLEVWGKEYGDIAFFMDVLLISKRMADLYRTEGLSGLQGFDEVEIVKVIRRGGSRLRTPPPPYYCVTIARSRATIDVAASGLVLREPYTCNECRGGLIVRTERVVLEEGTWSGEDIFIARGLPGTILTSERFKAFFDKYHINNGILVDAVEYSFDFYPGRSISEIES